MREQGDRMCAFPLLPVLWEKVGIEGLRLIFSRTDSRRIAKTLTLPSPGLPGEGKEGVAAGPLQLPLDA